jgi:integrase
MDGKKDGLQKYRVRINFQDNLGESRQIDRVAYGLEAAKALEIKLIHSIKEETPAKRITVQQLFEQYHESKKYEVRETTFYKTKSILNIHVIPYFKDTRLDKLTIQSLQKWKIGIEERASALNTRKNIYAEFAAMLNYAVKMELVSKNLLSKLGNFKGEFKDKTEINYYTVDEFKQFISSALQYAQNCKHISGWDFYVFFNIAFYTGLRKGEIHALKWTDITNNVLNVRRSISQHLKGDDRETRPKNKASLRALQIPAPLVKILDEHYERCKTIEGFKDDYRICGGIRPLRDSSLKNANKKYAKAAGVKTIRIHDFRHSHASVLANEGINIQEIARRLGHAKIEMTWNTYAHLYPREEEKAIEILNKI